MIKIEISNLEKIKELHKCYFEEFVKESFDKKVSDKKIDKKCIDFLKDYFYIDEKLNEELLINLCYADVEGLKNIITDFESKYKNYLKTKDLASDCLDRIGKYEEYLSMTEKGSHHERYDKWLSCISSIAILQDESRLANDNDELNEKIEEKINEIKK